MSTQRRRVLAKSGLIIPTDGIYIEGLNRKVYAVDNWQSSYGANSIVVASGDVKFRMALTQAPSSMAMSVNAYAPLDKYLTGKLGEDEAKLDYDGAGNTANILKVEPSTSCAAGYCNAYIFPDGKTKGYLPSFGQLWLIWEFRDVVDNVLSACGGDTIITSYKNYWSSTYEGNTKFYQIFWQGSISSGGQWPNREYYARPFADIT